MTLPENRSQQWEEMGDRVSDMIQGMTMNAVLRRPDPLITVMLKEHILTSTR